MVGLEVRKGQLIGLLAALPTVSQYREGAPLLRGGCALTHWQGEGLRDISD